MADPTPEQLTALRRFRPWTGDGRISLECIHCWERSGMTSDIGALFVMALGHQCDAAAPTT